MKTQKQNSGLKGHGSDSVTAYTAVCTDPCSNGVVWMYPAIRGTSMPFPEPTVNDCTEEATAATMSVDISMLSSADVSYTINLKNQVGGKPVFQTLCLMGTTQGE